MTKEDTDELIQRLLTELPCAIANGGYYVVKRSTIIMWLLDQTPTKRDVIHHKNENKLDDRPENLAVMTRGDHAAHHISGRFGKGVQRHSQEYRDRLSQRMKKQWATPGYAQKAIQSMKVGWVKRREKTALSRVDVPENGTLQ